MPAHIAAVQALIGGQGAKEEQGDKKEAQGLPTLAQFKLSRELAGEPCTAQGAEQLGRLRIVYIGLFYRV